MKLGEILQCEVVNWECELPVYICCTVGIVRGSGMDSTETNDYVVCTYIHEESRRDLGKIPQLCCFIVLHTVTHFT